MIYTLRRYVGKSLACQCLTAVLASAASTSSRGDGEDLSAELLDEFLRNDLPEEEKVLTRLEYKKFECFPHNCTVLSTGWRSATPVRPIRCVLIYLIRE